MSEFRIQIASDTDHEELIAEIYFGDEFVALINEEKGAEHPEIELHPRKDGEPHRFALSDFEAAIERAKARLHELRRVPDPGPDA